MTMGSLLYQEKQNICDALRYTAGEIYTGNLRMETIFQTFKRSYQYQPEL